MQISEENAELSQRWPGSNQRAHGEQTREQRPGPLGYETTEHCTNEYRKLLCIIVKNIIATKSVAERNVLIRKEVFKRCADRNQSVCLLLTIFIGASRSEN